MLISIMFTMGLTIEYAKMVLLMKQPKAVLIAFFCQFGFMPAAAFTLTKIFGLENYAALTLLLIGCSPGGNISNLLAYFFDGDMNLSILLTCCSSVVGVGLMPLNIYLWSLLLTTHNDLVIPYGRIMVSIAITIIPVLIGSYISNYKQKYAKIAQKIGMIIVVLVSFVVMGMAIYLFGDLLIRYFPFELVGACAILPFVGYCVGFTSSYMLGLEPRSCRTIMIETGCQNAQISASILKLSFSPLLVGVYFIVPMVYMFLQIGELFPMKLIWTYMCSTNNNASYVIADHDSDSDSDKLTIEIGNEVKMVSSKNRPKSVLQDIQEAWPLDGKPSKSSLSSFQCADSERYC